MVLLKSQCRAICRLPFRVIVSLCVGVFLFLNRLACLSCALLDTHFLDGEQGQAVDDAATIITIGRTLGFHWQSARHLHRLSFHQATGLSLSLSLSVKNQQFISLAELLTCNRCTSSSSSSSSSDCLTAAYD